MYQVLLEYDYGDWQSGWLQEIMCDEPFAKPLGEL